MSKSCEWLEAKDRDGNPIKLVPDEINLLGLGWDVFESDSATYPILCRTFFKEIKEIESVVREGNYNSGGIANVLEIRRFDVKLDPDWYAGFEEDPERLIRFGYYKWDGKWIFRAKSYKEFYEGTPAERWVGEDFEDEEI